MTSYFFALGPPSKCECSNTFRKPVVLPSSGKGKHLFW